MLGTIYTLQLLGSPREGQEPPVIDQRTHAGRTIEEAARTAKEHVLNTPVEGTYGFRLLDQSGAQVHIWYNGQDDA
jgi:hypothetical protein